MDLEKSGMTGDRQGSSAAFAWDEITNDLTSNAGSRLNIGEACADRHVAAGHGERVAVRCLGRRLERRDLSYARLAELSGRLASVLIAQGIKPGDTVAVLLNRVPDLYVAALGIWKAGAVYCPLSPGFGPGPLRARLELGKARILIASDELYGRKLAPGRASLAHVHSVFLVGPAGEPAKPAEACQDLAPLMKQAVPVAAAATSAADPAFLHFTSGTTGTPKGVLHSHGAVLAQYMTGRTVFDLTERDIFWCTADPGWVAGTAYGIIAPLACGATALADEAELDPRRWYGILQDEKVTAWYTTPTAIRTMMRFGAALARSFRENSLRVAASVGEPLNAEAVSWGQKALGVPFLDTWWQTETGAVVIANAPGQGRRPGSMGRPLPGVEAAVVRRNGHGVDVLDHVDEVGELALRQDWPSMFQRYLGTGEAEAACRQEGWYLTGDLVRRDADGFYWFVGRADDMIKCGAQQIGPFEVESTLMDHPSVAEVGVVGKPDLLLREVPVAFASLNPGFEAGNALMVELLSFARHELGTTLAPREIHFISELPKTTTGKIMRRALKAKALGEPDALEDAMPALSPCPGRFDDE